VSADPTNRTKLPADESPWAAADRSAAAVHDRLGRHSVAVVLGSGWSQVADALGSPSQIIEMSAVHMTSPGVPGHGGTIRSVIVAGQPTLVLSGRIHLYEGHGAAAVCHSVRSAVLAGCSTVILTNAAGSLRARFAVGDAVLTADHLNLTGTNPMVGPPPPGNPSSRFVDLTNLYNEQRRAGIRTALPHLDEGVYAGMLGGSYETPAEIQMLAGMGADLVGMSTVLEAIAARQLGATVTGISLVTNMAAGQQDHLDHQEVLDVAANSTDRLVEVVHAAVAQHSVASEPEQPIG